MLEHRWEKRRQVSLDVVVRNRNGLTVHGRIRDISSEGMFIQLSAQAISTSSVVEIEFSPHGCLHSWVVHSGDKGIGVMFLSAGDSEQKLLEQLLPGKFINGAKDAP
ncbi:MAG TPA: PilZ domain-containing protein [Gammaproteobacteria bacterium]|nr:PilZ domain-containing protein [Gammaproteobacteria bacterium]